MYRYRFDQETDLLDIEWLGLFDAAGVADYAAGLRADFTRHRFLPGYRLLIDMSGSNIHPQATLPSFRAHFADFPKASRIAIITRSTLHRLQILREMPQPYLRVVPTRGAAFAWLVEGREPDPPQADLSSLPRLRTWSPSSCSTR